VVAFSYAQTCSLGFAVIALAGARHLQKAGLGQPYGKAVREAWRNGRAAAWLPAVDYPALFALPLDEARRQLNIQPSTVYESVPFSCRDGMVAR
jgi:ubiquinone biosynthesis protein COQ4